MIIIIIIVVVVVVVFYCAIDLVTYMFSYNFVLPKFKKLIWQQLINKAKKIMAYVKTSLYTQ